MRIGFVCGPKELVQKIVVVKQVNDVHTNQFFQMLCAEYISNYDLDKHIKGIRKLYKTKGTAMIEALKKYMPAEVKFTVPEGGLFLWLTLPDKMDMPAFVRKASENKVFVVPGVAFNCDESAPSQSFRLNYSMPSLEDIDNGIQLLSDIIRRYL
jgi:2-aminoadipate transaminase